MIPDMTKAAHALLRQAELDRDTAAKPTAKSLPSKSAAALERERSQREAEQEQSNYIAVTLFDSDMEIERLSPIMDAVTVGIEPDAPVSDIVRAGKLAVEHERETVGALVASLHARYGQDGRASAIQNQAVEYQPATDSFYGDEITSIAKPSPFSAAC